MGGWRWGCNFREAGAVVLGAIGLLFGRGSGLVPCWAWVLRWAVLGFVFFGLSRARSLEINRLMIAGASTKMGRSVRR